MNRDRERLQRILDGSLDLVLLLNNDGTVLEASAAAAALTRAVIAMGKALGLHIIGEGVEQLAQLRFLAEQGCDAAQGFPLSHPLPAAEFRTRFLWSAQRTAAFDAPRT